VKHQCQPHRKNLHLLLGMMICPFSPAEKLTSRFWVLNRKSNGSFQVSFLFKSLSKNREVIFCVILNYQILMQSHNLGIEPIYGFARGTAH
jgi:hypothetical protein